MSYRKKKGVQTPSDYQIVKTPSYPGINFRLPLEQFSSPNNFPPPSFSQVTTGARTQPKLPPSYFPKPQIDHLFLSNYQKSPEQDKVVQLIKKNFSPSFHWQPDHVKKT